MSLLLLQGARERQRAFGQLYLAPFPHSILMEELSNADEPTATAVADKMAPNVDSLLEGSAPADEADGIALLPSSGKGLRLTVRRSRAGKLEYHHLETNLDAHDGKPCAAHVKGKVVLMVGAGGSSNHPAPADHKPDVIFVLDSGAAVHVCNSFPAFTSMAAVPPGRLIQAANGHTLQILGSGSVVLQGFRLKGVLFVPDVTRNLISVSQLIKLDYSVEFCRRGCFVRDCRNDGAVVGKGNLVGGLYELEFLEIPLDRAPACNSQQ